MAIRYVKISVTDFEVGRRLLFPIYAQARGTDNFILYVKRGKVLTQQIRDKMRERKNFTYYIDAADIERYRTYLYNLAQATDKKKKRDRVIRRVHDALALEEAVEQERRQPEFGKFPFIWWGLGIVLIAMLCAKASVGAITALAFGGLGGLIMSLILLGLSLATEKEEEEETIQPTTITCPHCKNKLPAPQVDCQFCGRPVFGDARTAAIKPPPRNGAALPGQPQPGFTQTIPPPLIQPGGAPSAVRSGTTAPAAEPAEHRTVTGPPNGMGIAAGGVAPI
ncbi:MAG: hypothetical protein E3J72_10860 [Planctomycetota bacterium]|nr:MAG: hypothetical protein E3J72_10860 [Planctomycetota bacterium]